MAHHIQASLLPLLVAEAPDVVATLQDSGSAVAICTASSDALGLVTQAIVGPPSSTSVPTLTSSSTLSDISQRLSQTAAPRATLLQNAEAAEKTSRYTTGHALSAYAATGEFLSAEVARFVDGARLTAPLSDWLSGTLPLSALDRRQHSRHAIWEQVMWRLALLVDKKGTLEALRLIYPEHAFEAAEDALHHSLPYPHIPLPLLSNADQSPGAPRRFILFSFVGHRGDPSTTGAATYRRLLLQYFLLHSHTGDHEFSYTLPFPLDAPAALDKAARLTSLATSEWKTRSMSTLFLRVFGTSSIFLFRTVQRAIATPHVYTRGDPTFAHSRLSGMGPPDRGKTMVACANRLFSGVASASLCSQLL